MVVLLTTCSAFDLFLEHPAVVGALSDHRSKRYAPVVRLRDFDGELDFLTSLELKHGLQFAQNHSSPKYMLDLYSSMETGEDRVHPSSDEVNAITDSDTVRSFTANVKGKERCAFISIAEASGTYHVVADHAEPLTCLGKKYNGANPFQFWPLYFV